LTAETLIQLQRVIRGVLRQRRRQPRRFVKCLRRLGAPPLARQLLREIEMRRRLRRVDRDRSP